MIAGTGCGTTERDHVERVFRAWLVAAAADDHERLCALMTAEYRNQEHGRGGEVASVEDCVADHRRLSSPATPRQQRGAKEAEIVNIESEGDTATAFIRHRGCTHLASHTEFRQ